MNAAPTKETSTEMVSVGTQVSPTLKSIDTQTSHPFPRPSQPSEEKALTPKCSPPLVLTPICSPPAALAPTSVKKGNRPLSISVKRPGKYAFSLKIFLHPLNSNP